MNQHPGREPIESDLAVQLGDAYASFYCIDVSLNPGPPSDFNTLISGPYHIMCPPYWTIEVGPFPSLVDADEERQKAICKDPEPAFQGQLTELRTTCYEYVMDGQGQMYVWATTSEPGEDRPASMTLYDLDRHVGTEGNRVESLVMPALPNLKERVFRACAHVNQLRKDLKMYLNFATVLVSVHAVAKAKGGS